MLRIGIAQEQFIPGAIEANYQIHAAAIERAREESLDILVFPELSLTDYVVTDSTIRLGMTCEGGYIELMAQLAQHVTVSFGFIEKLNGKIYNTQALVRAGRTISLHRKLNIPNYGNLNEGRYFQKCAELESAVSINDWATSTLICADLWNPALPFLCAVRGAELMLVPSASALGAVGGNFDNPSGWDTVLKHTALLYGLPVVFANHCGSRDGLEFWGGSRIVDPSGKVIVQAGNQSEFIIGNVAKSDLARARKLLPTLRDADPDLIARLLTGVLADEISSS